MDDNFDNRFQKPAITTNSYEAITKRRPKRAFVYQIVARYGFG